MLTNDLSIEQLILPYFNTYMNTDVNSGLFDLSGTIIGITPKKAELFNLNAADILGMSYKNLDHGIIKKACRLENESTEELNSILRSFKQISVLHEAVIAEKKLINYLDFIPYKSSVVVELVNNFPLFNLNGDVVAVQSMSTPYYLFGIHDYFQETCKLSSLNAVKNFKPILSISEREHDVLFLLYCRFNQAEIASILGISAGSISTMIKRMCDKFHIRGINTRHLLNKARQVGFNEYIPKRFSLRQIIVLDPHVKNKYFSG